MINDLLKAKIKNPKWIPTTNQEAIEIFKHYTELYWNRERSCNHGSEKWKELTKELTLFFMRINNFKGFYQIVDNNGGFILRKYNDSLEKVFQNKKGEYKDIYENSIPNDILNKE